MDFFYRRTGQDNFDKVIPRNVGDICFFPGKFGEHSVFWHFGDSNRCLPSVLERRFFGMELYSDELRNAVRMAGITLPFRLIVG